MTTHIIYDRGQYGHWIRITEPGPYPFYQVSCTDEDFGTGVKVFPTEEDVKEYVAFILRHADAWRMAA